MKPLALIAAMACAPVLWCASAGDLQKELDRISSSPRGLVGVAAVLIESGEHVAFHGDQPSFMASTVKFPVALHGTDHPSPRVMNVDGHASYPRAARELPKLSLFEQHR